MIVYIQKFGGEIANDNAFTAYLGFDHLRLRDNSIEIRFFDEISTVRTKIDVNGIRPMVVGFVEDTMKYFRMCGVDTPFPLNIPNELTNHEFTRRNIEVKTLREFKEDTNVPVFVKPYSYLKKFASGVIKEQSSRKTLFEKDDYGEQLDNDMLVQTSTVIDMISEYRCFVREGKLMDIRHYLGDCTIFPDVIIIDNMIKTYVSAPKAYTLDVAVVREAPKTMDDFRNPLNNYKTVIVECNDMWSIGPYGLDPVVYANMLKVRWYEIFKPTSPISDHFTKLGYK